MNSIHLLFLGLVFTSFTANGQNKDHTSKWDFKLGYENTRLLDHQNSPLVYSAHSMVLGADFSRIKRKTVWGLTLSTAIGSSQSKRFGQRYTYLKDPYDIYGNRDEYLVEGNPSLAYLHANLSYCFQLSVNLHEKEFQLGGQLNNDFFTSAIGLDTWFFNNLSLSPMLSTRFDLKDGSYLPFQISFPLVSYIVREPYGKDPSIPLDNYFEANIKTGSSFATIDTFQKVVFTAGYRRNWKSKWDIGFDYTFYWYHYRRPDHLRAYSNQLSIVLTKTNY